MKVTFYRHSLFSRGGDKMVADYANFLAEKGQAVVMYTNEISTLFERMLVDLLYIMAFRFRFGAIKTIAVSENLASLLKKRYGAKNVTTVTNGIDHRIFYPEIDDELMEARGGRKAIFVFSRGDYRKGFDIALRVLNELSDRLLDKAVVWVIGEEVQGAVLNLSLKNFGWVNEEHLRKILSSADLFLHPTRHEGFGLFQAEAMACGCPVVTTEAVPYAVNGENAVVCRVEDVEGIKEGVLKIFQDTDLVNKIREGGFWTAGKYDIAESRRRFLEAVGR